MSILLLLFGQFKHKIVTLYHSTVFCRLCLVWCCLIRFLLDNLVLLSIEMYIGFNVGRVDF